MNRRVQPSFRIISLLALAVSCPASVSAFQPPMSCELVARGDVTSTLWSILLPPRGETDPDLDRIATSIAALGASGLDPTVAILFGDEPEPDFTHAVHPWMIDRRQDILVNALKRLSNADVVAAIRSRAAEQPSVDRTLFTARVLGRIGGLNAILAIESLAPTLDGIQWQRPYVVNIFEESLVAIANEDPKHVKRLGEALARAEVRVAPVFARAIASPQKPSAVPLLLRAVGRDRDLDLCIMTELAKFGDRGDTSGSTGEISRLRSYCESTDPGVRRCAAQALAKLGDEDSLGPIIAMLDSRNALTIQTAEKCLTTLTGLALGRDSKPWNAWRERELEWFETHHQRLLEEIASNDVTRVADAIREFAGHRLFRHQAAEAISPLIVQADAELQRQACIALGLFGSGRGLTPLLERLEFGDDAVRAEAEKALKKITGLAITAELEGWRAAILGA